MEAAEAERSAAAEAAAKEQQVQVVAFKGTVQRFSDRMREFNEEARETSFSVVSGRSVTPSTRGTVAQLMHCVLRRSRFETLQSHASRTFSCAIHAVTTRHTPCSFSAISLRRARGIVRGRV